MNMDIAALSGGSHKIFERAKLVKKQLLNSGLNPSFDIDELVVETLYSISRIPLSKLEMFLNEIETYISKDICDIYRVFIEKLIRSSEVVADFYETAK